MKRNAVILIVVACIFSAIGIYAGMKKFALEAAQTTAVSDLFATSLPDSSGKTQFLSKWKGKILVVNFWATWCAPCVQEIPELSTLQVEANEKNIQIIGIGIDSSANIAQFAANHKISYPLYVADPSAIELSKKFGNQSGGLPFTILIEANGEIKKTFLGRIKLAELKRDLDLP